MAGDSAASGPPISQNIPSTAGIGSYTSDGLPIPVGFKFPNITQWDTPWYLRGNISSVPPPYGVIPNFIDPPSKVYLDIITQSVCLPIATILTLIRVYTKIYLIRSPGWEDWTAVIGWMGLMIWGALCIASDRYGSGRHLWDVKGVDFTMDLKITYVREILYGPIIFAVKLAILLLFLRVFQPIRRTYIALHLLLWGNLLIYTAGTFLEIFQCSPIRKKWYPAWPGQCVDQRALQLASSAVNIASDISILVLPIMSVWDLNTTRKRKAGLFLVFGFGILGCVASITRLVDIIQHDFRTDITWGVYELNLWTTAEITCGIICGCLPTIPAFIRHMPRIHIVVSFATRTSRRSDYYYPHPHQASEGSGSHGGRRGDGGGGERSGGRSGKSSKSSGAGGRGGRKDTGIVLASKSSDPSTRKHRKEVWEELDDLDYKGGDEFMTSSESLEKGGNMGSGFDLPIQKPLNGGEGGARGIVDTMERGEGRELKEAEIRVTEKAVR